MTEEKAFDGFVKVLTKTFGASNDPDDATLYYETEKFSSKEARLVLLLDSKFITSGNATFLVGTPFIGIYDDLFELGSDADTRPSTPELTQKVWIPIHEILCILK